LDYCQFLPEPEIGQGPVAAFWTGLSQIANNANFVRENISYANKDNITLNSQDNSSAHCSNPWIWLLACDLPRLEKAILQQWIAQLDKVPPHILAVVPRQEERWEPLCGFYRLEAIANLTEFIEGGGRSFQSWLADLPVRPLAVGKTEAEMLWNCNSREDLDKEWESR